MTADFSSKIKKVKKNRTKTFFSELKNTYYSLRILYSAKMYSRNEGEINISMDEGFVTSLSILKE